MSMYFTRKFQISVYSAEGVSLLPRRRWPRRGRKRNAGDALGYGAVLRPIEILPNRRPDGTHCPSDYCPYSSSVTKMGSEVPILATACALRSTRLAALTVHRTVIHYRQLRFAYLGGSVGRSAPQQPPNRTINSNLKCKNSRDVTRELKVLYRFFLF